MKLFYRATSYDYDPNQAQRGNTGRPVRPASATSAPYTLVYRGSLYTVDPTVRSTEAPLPNHYELICRGTAYQVDRNAQGSVSIEARPVGTQRKPAVFPAALPQSYVAKIHQSNLMQNLQRRIKAAQDRGDQYLVNQLESERQQLIAQSV